MSRYPAISPLVELAEDQWGLVTRRQALDRGVSRRSWERLTTGGMLEKIAHGIYRLRGAPPPDHEQLRAAWLQLAPVIPAWERSGEQGVVSHRSAADLYRVGHLPEERHDFTVVERRQTRRPDVRLHRRALDDSEWITLHGLPVTRPSRIASDLLFDQEDPSAVAQIISDSLRNVYDYPSTIAVSLAPHAAKFGLRHGDGLALLKVLLDLVGDQQVETWMSVAHEIAERDRPAPALAGSASLS